MVDNHANGKITNPTVKALDASLKTLKTYAETIFKMSGGQVIVQDVQKELDPMNFTSADRRDS